MFSDKQKEYSNIFYIDTIREYLEGHDVNVLMYVLEELEEEEDYEGCEGIMRGLKRISKSKSKKELIEELNVIAPKWREMKYKEI